MPTQNISRHREGARPPRWTRGRDQRLLKLHRDGTSLESMAEQFGRTERAVRQRLRLLLSENGHSRTRRRIKTEEIWQRIAALCTDQRGRTVMEMSTALGEPLNAIRHLVKTRHRAGEAHVAGFLVRGRVSAVLWLPWPGRDAEPVDPEPVDEQRAVIYEQRQILTGWPGREKTPFNVGALRQHEVIVALFGMAPVAM